MGFNKYNFKQTKHELPTRLQWVLNLRLQAGKPCYYDFYEKYYCYYEFSDIDYVNFIDKSNTLL